MSTELPGRSQTADSFFETMVQQFTPFEWRFINKAGATDAQRVATFMRLWCLKESYIKAVGIGLGFDLQRAEFHLDDDTIFRDMNDTATVEEYTSLFIDKRNVAEWAFEEVCLDAEHMAAVATGPVVDACESYAATLPLKAPDARARTGKARGEHPPAKGGFKKWSFDELVAGM